MMTCLLRYCSSPASSSVRSPSPPNTSWCFRVKLSCKGERGEAMKGEARRGEVSDRTDLKQRLALGGKKENALHAHGAPTLHFVIWPRVDSIS